MNEFALSVLLIQVVIVLTIFCLECCALSFYNKVHFSGARWSPHVFTPISWTVMLLELKFNTQLQRDFKASGIVELLQNENVKSLVQGINLLLQSARDRTKLDGNDPRNYGLHEEAPNDPQSIVAAFEDIFVFLNGFASGKKDTDVQLNDFVTTLERCIRLLYGWQHKYRDVFGEMRPLETKLTIEQITKSIQEYLLEDNLLGPSSLERLPIGNMHSNISVEKRMEIDRLTPNPKWIFLKTNYLPITDIGHYPKFYLFISIVIPLLLILILGIMLAIDLSLSYWFSVYFCSLIPWPQLCRDIFGPNWKLLPFDFGYRVHAQLGIASLLCLCIFIYGVILKAESIEVLDPALMIALKVFSAFPLFFLASIGYEGVYLFATLFLCEGTCTHHNVIRKAHVLLAILYLWTLYDLNAIGGMIAIVSFGLAAAFRIYVYIITFRVARLHPNRSIAPEREFKLIQPLSSALSYNQLRLSQVFWMYDYMNCLALDLFVTPIYMETEIDPNLGIIPTKRMSYTSRLLLREFPIGLNSKLCRLWHALCCLSCLKIINALLQICCCQGYEMRGDEKLLHDQQVCLCRTRAGYSILLHNHINGKHQIIWLVTELGLNSSLISIKKFTEQVYSTHCDMLVLVADLSSQTSILTFANAIYAEIEELCDNFIALNSSLDHEAIISGFGIVFERIKITVITRSLDEPKETSKEHATSFPILLYRNLESSVGRFPLGVRKYLLDQMGRLFADILHYTSTFEQISFRRYVLAQALKTKVSVDAEVIIFAFCSTSEALILRSQFADARDVQIVYLTEHDISSTVAKPTLDAATDLSYAMRGL